jgi:cell division inhibitor SepF
MTNAFKRVANYLGLVDEEDDLQPVVETPEPRRTPRVRPVTPTWAAPAESSSVRVAPSAPSQMQTQVTAQSAMQTELPIMDQIFTIHPRFYNEARTVGEKYRSGQPVLMNLSDMDETERKRLVDFASGLVFGHYGSIERVTSKVFLLTPPNVRVSSEGKAAAAEASFFNQS